MPYKLSLTGIAEFDTEVMEYQEKVLFGFNEIQTEFNTIRVIFQSELAKKAYEQIKLGDKVKIEGDCHINQAQSYDSAPFEFKEVFVQSFELLSN